MASKRRVPAGKPFIKGDSRINKRGPVSIARQVFSIEFNNALAERADAKVLVEKLVTLAEHGVEWAMKEVLERTIGKVPQPLSGNFNVTGKLSVEALKKSVKEADGTGD